MDENQLAFESLDAILILLRSLLSWRIHKSFRKSSKIQIQIQIQYIMSMHCLRMWTIHKLCAMLKSYYQNERKKEKKEKRTKQKKFCSMVFKDRNGMNIENSLIHRWMTYSTLFLCYPPLFVSSFFSHSATIHWILYLHLHCAHIESVMLATFTSWIAANSIASIDSSVSWKCVTFIAYTEHRFINFVAFISDSIFFFCSHFTWASERNVK